MDIDEEIDWLGLPPAKQSLAWEARAKITWGDSAADVQAWLVGQGIEPVTAEQILAIAIRERARAIRLKGVWDLVLGILASVGGAVLGIGMIVMVKDHVAGVRIPMAITVAAFVAMTYGVYLTGRGLVRIVGGSRVKGAVSDVND